jgi:putative ABC transport system ATP-binding protein
MIPLDRGELLLQGRPDHQWLPMQWRTRVALLLQTHHMVPGTVEENLLFPWTLKIRRSSDGPGRGAEKPGAQRLRTALDGAGLEEVALTADAGKLSVGQTARLSFIRTLLTRPDCLLLDEPFAALDPETRATIQERILAFAREGGAVLLVAHDETLSLGSRTLRLDQGRLTEESS